MHCFARDPAAMPQAGPRCRVLMTTDTVGGVFSYALTLCRALVRRGVDVVLATMGAPLQPAQRAALAAAAAVGGLGAANATVSAGNQARAGLHVPGLHVPGLHVPGLHVPGLHVIESSYRLEWMAEPWPWDDVDRAGAWLLDLEAAWQPDVVHLNGYAHGSLPWRAPVLMVAHSCVLSWWRAVKGEDAPAAWDTYRRRVRQGLAGARLVVAPTLAMLHALARCHGPLPDARVIWNGCDAVGGDAGCFASADPEGADPATAGDGAGASAARAGDDTGGGADTDKLPLVLCAGRLWDQAKNLSALAACSASLPWPVYVAGAMHPPPAPDASASGAPAPDGNAPGASAFGEPAPDASALGATAHMPVAGPGPIRALGWLAPADLAQWLSWASIYALPARYEPFGLSVLEAALCGCALVLGDIPSLRELWAGAAVFVPPDQPEALGRAIAGLAACPAQRRVLAARARARARDFSVDRMVDQYLAVYASLAFPGRRWQALAGAVAPGVA